MKMIGEVLVGRAVVTVSTEATVQEAVKRMAESKIGALMILDDQEAPIGIFTERDLMLRVVGAGVDPKTARIADYMTREVFSVSPERTVSDSAHEMQSRHIRHLPIVKDGELIGLLSLRDLLRELLQVKRAEVKALTAYIQGAEGGSVELDPRANEAN